MAEPSFSSIDCSRVTRLTIIIWKPWRTGDPGDAYVAPKKRYNGWY